MTASVTTSPQLLQRIGSDSSISSTGSQHEWQTAVMHIARPDTSPTGLKRQANWQTRMSQQPQKPEPQFPNFLQAIDGHVKTNIGIYSLEMPNKNAVALFQNQGFTMPDLGKPKN